MREAVSVRTPATHPARWVAAAIVLAVLSWDVWQTLREIRAAAREQPAHTAIGSAGANDSTAAHAVTAPP